MEALGNFKIIKTVDHEEITPGEDKVHGNRRTKIITEDPYISLEAKKKTADN